MRVRPGLGKRQQFQTLDEYLKNKPKPAFELPAQRRPNEGADESQWKDVVPLEKDEEELFGDLKVRWPIPPGARARARPSPPPRAF